MSDKTMKVTIFLICMVLLVQVCYVYCNAVSETGDNLTRNLQVEENVELFRSKRSLWLLNPRFWQWANPKEWIRKVGKGYSYLTIYPGTKWCGDGARARNFHDLGWHKKPDMCCRAHDLCSINVEAGKTRYGISNTGKITWSSCQCDDQFYSCLKKANTIDSHVIGVAYFDLLNNYCILQDYPVKCNTKKVWGIFKKKTCSRDTSKPKKWQKKKIGKSYLKTLS